jgi:3',5'-cyclic AMP phosphodiesterase CpdA
MLNFCAESPSHISPYRATMTQPYVYWTLMAPFVSIIGLYSNVEGSLDARGTYEQEKWLEDQLRAVDKDSFLVVAVHHPPYSLDKAHGGTPDIASAIDQAIEVTGVVPHMVVSGHVHSYQRFTRRLKGRQIPYIVDGRGGYANAPKLMHKLQTDAQGNLPEAPVKTPSEIDPGLDLTLESFDQENPGFLRFTVTGRDTLTVESFRVPFEGTFTGEPADSVTVTHKGKIR